MLKISIDDREIEQIIRNKCNIPDFVTNFYFENNKVFIEAKFMILKLTFEAKFLRYHDNKAIFTYSSSVPLDNMVVRKVISKYIDNYVVISNGTLEVDVNKIINKYDIPVDIISINYKDSFFTVNCEIV